MCRNLPNTVPKWTPLGCIGFWGLTVREHTCYTQKDALTRITDWLELTAQGKSDLYAFRALRANWQAQISAKPQRRVRKLRAHIVLEKDATLSIKWLLAC